MKKIISVLLSAVIAVSSTTVSMAAVKFSDINNVPWEGAKNYMVKVAELGLMVGQENGNGTSLFRAKDKVTYCETVQLAYNILKNEGKAEVSQETKAKWKSVMSGYKIPEWAHEAVSYALENQIISITDLSGFMTTKGANNNATREDVAVIFGRALSAEYDIKNNPVLTFADKDKILSSSVPYVNLLSELNILVGDDDKNFNPKNLINRAEMAVVTTKTYSVVSGEKINTDVTSVTGTINYMTSEKIIVNLEKGGTEVYPLAKNANILLNNKAVAINNITKTIDNGITVNVVLKFSNGTVTEVLAEGLENTVQGTITKISSREVTIKRTKGSTKSYSFANNILVKYDGENSRISRIIDAFDDSTELYVTAKLDEYSDIDEMIVNVSQLGGSVKGFLKKVTDDKIVVAISDTDSETYYIDTEPIVTYQGDEITYSKLVSKFESGTAFTATVYLNSSKTVSKIEAKMEDNDTGVVTNLTDTYITIFTSAGVSRKCLLSKDVDIKFYGGSTESVSYLKSVYETGKTEVTLTFNRKDEVIKVLVDLDQKKYNRISGEIEQMDKDSMKVGKKTVYSSENTVVNIDESESTWATLYNALQSGESYDVKVTFADDIARNVVAELTGAEGKVQDIKYGEITLNTNTGIKTYELAKDEDLKIRIDGGKTSYDFREFYSLWYGSKNNYSVILTIDKGVVVRINATTL
ncbi:MAG: S-layer homology domain-containing protein [Lachnospiraceae bacterium]|nr:S-layer homology domain-containing protein [Lachnospiraceae bacterium]